MMWLLYWSTELKSSCKHHFLTAVSFCCINCCVLKRCVSLRLLNFIRITVSRYSSMLAAVLQALTLGQMRSDDYSTTEIFVNNFLLSIMSTNRFSPAWHWMNILIYLQLCQGRNQVPHTHKHTLSLILSRLPAVSSEGRTERDHC